MEVLLAAFLALPGNHCSAPKAETLVKAAYASSKRYPNVPPEVILAVAMAETKCRNVISPKTYDGGVDVGYTQVHVVDPNSTRVKFYLDPRNNLTRSAKILSWSYDVCTGRGKNWKGCKVTVWKLYNYRSNSWWPKVNFYLKKLQKQPVV